MLRNRAFRRLWLAQAVSLVGDWFTLIAPAVAVSRASGGSGALRRMRRLIVAGSALIATALGALALAPTLGATCLAIVLRGMGGSTNWTYSTVILQKLVPDELRGRGLALDLACLTLTATVAALAWGWAIDRVGVRPVLLVVAAVCGLAGLTWAALLPWMERAED